MRNYRQCLLMRGTQTVVGWIEMKPGLAAGKRVEMLPDKELWDVVEVWGYIMPEDRLKKLQSMHRNSLLSIEPMGAPAKQVAKVE